MIIIKEKIIRLVNSDKVFNTLFNLHERWLDERKYEDFKDYEEVMKKSIEDIEGVKFIKGSKRPFGFIVSIGDANVKVYLKNKGRNTWTLAAAIQH